ncbi:MAG: hydrogenase formation protein HypD [Agathobacter sp.]|uniref:hydrogenase formation protein HypD n=1 Tax=Agathobacter sp. TaxID=2021311 RepID=UPI00258F9A0E|nr:hydrogenase formation protein HypD [Agathobacter sp.]MCR5676922.1 hydrogenase formation protein HypD [Agathobacter sp.]
MEIKEIIEYLQNYQGPVIRLMEVCGSHTAAISKFGIRDLLSDRIELISGPGCPVCVTPSAYVDRLIELAKEPNTCVATFGDLLRVPGSSKSLSESKADGANAQMVYSPMDILRLAKDNPMTNYVFAAVGFETTAPLYALLIEEAMKQNLSNIRILTALKSMPNVIAYLLRNEAQIDGFLAPGHVCAITGADYFGKLAEEFHIPFAVSGFGDEELVVAIYGLVRMIEQKETGVKNFYPSVVESGGNAVALDKLNTYFEPCTAAWRGMGEIEGSGFCLRKEYAQFDAGSIGLKEDKKKNHACRCGEILMGKAKPTDCPLFARVCNPSNPQGACMVSYEGSCFTAFQTKA